VSAVKSLPAMRRPAPVEDQTPHGVFEAGRAEAPVSGEVAAVAVEDDRQRGEPGAGAERLPGGVQGGRPDAVEQVAHLLELAADLGEQLLAARAGVPQPGPGFVDRLRLVAAQLGGEPGHEDRVFLIGLVVRLVLGRPSYAALRAGRAPMPRCPPQLWCQE